MTGRERSNGEYDQLRNSFATDSTDRTAGSLLGRSAPLALLIMDILVKPHTDIDRSTLREFVGVQLNKTPLPGVPKEGFGAPEQSGFLICVIRGKAVAELVVQKDSSA